MTMTVRGSSFMGTHMLPLHAGGAARCSTRSIVHGVCATW